MRNSVPAYSNRKRSSGEGAGRHFRRMETLRSAHYAEADAPDDGLRGAPFFRGDAKTKAVTFEIQRLVKSVRAIAF